MQGECYRCFIHLFIALLLYSRWNAFDIRAPTSLSKCRGFQTRYPITFAGHLDQSLITGLHLIHDFARKVNLLYDTKIVCCQYRTIYQLTEWDVNVYTNFICWHRLKKGLIDFTDILLKDNSYYIICISIQIKGVLSRFVPLVVYFDWYLFLGQWRVRCLSVQQTESVKLEVIGSFSNLLEEVN